MWPENAPDTQETQGRNKGPTSCLISTLSCALCNRWKVWKRFYHSAMYVFCFKFLMLVIGVCVCVHVHVHTNVFKGLFTYLKGRLTECEREKSVSIGSLCSKGHSWVRLKLVARAARIPELSFIAFPGIFGRSWIKSRIARTWTTWQLDLLYQNASPSSCFIPV